MFRCSEWGMAELYDTQLQKRKRHYIYSLLSTYLFSELTTSSNPRHYFLSSESSKQKHCSHLAFQVYQLRCSAEIYTGLPKPQGLEGSSRRCVGFHECELHILWCYVNSRCSLWCWTSPNAKVPRSRWHAKRGWHQDRDFHVGEMQIQQKTKATAGLGNRRRLDLVVQRLFEETLGDVSLSFKQNSTVTCKKECDSSLVIFFSIWELYWPLTVYLLYSMSYCKACTAVIHMQKHHISRDILRIDLEEVVAECETSL